MSPGADVSGVRLSGLSTVNKKAVGLVGGILIAIGIAGMVIVDLQAKQAIANADIWQTEGFWFEMKEYAFMFIMIAGLMLVIYALLSLQRAKAKRLGNAR